MGTNNRFELRKTRTEALALLDSYRRHISGFLGKRSVESYLYMAAKFMETIGWNASNFTQTAAEDYIAMNFSMRKTDSGKTISATTRNLRIAALHSFGEWLVKVRHALDSNPMDEVRRAKPAKRLPKFLTEEEIERLLNAQDVKTPEGLRNRALLEFFVCTGCRVSEVSDLTLDQLDIPNATALILGKGNKERCVYLSDECIEWLKKYIKKARAGWKAKSDHGDMPYVFTNENYVRCSRQVIYGWVSAAGRKAKIKKTIHPHLLRHSFGTKMVREGANIVSVQQLLGHSSLATTQVYVSVTENDKKNAVQRIFNRKKTEEAAE